MRLRAVRGSRVPGPGAKLFSAFQNALGQLPIIAEDLGVITDDGLALRDGFELPRMRILQFAFASDDKNPSCVITAFRTRWLYRDPRA